MEVVCNVLSPTTRGKNKSMLIIELEQLFNLIFYSFIVSKHKSKSRADILSELPA
uniref:Uncharacterized protein n=1 Tax=Utricularia reniformis TaxID=192314 RepID=A0A1Y0B0L8_9LAMI|nr:hypothetical protein AEK19_MT0691 [Utricularia reniformis]ART30939.1 hypothetical protein AEK19_MT0691 [Utricularia reniformis]